MKKILCLTAAFITLLMLPVAVYAEEGTIDVHYLVVVQTDGTESQYALSDAPAISFKDGDVVVTCNSKEITFDMAGIANYHFITKKETTGIAHVETTPGSAAQPSFTFEDASFSGLKAGTRILVYTIEGKLVQTITAAQDGTAKVNLTGMPHGIYILRTPNKSFKIFNK